MRRSAPGLAIPMLLLGLILTLAPVAAPPAGTPGGVTERVICASDPAQTYALYLPAAYTPDRRWPILVLMDPRGRALVPLELFRERAARRGWILASSWHTLSDGPAEANVKAMNAMLPDLRDRVSMDPKRLYLGGFSGTARAAFEFAGMLSGRVAGVVAACGGLPEGVSLARAPAFDWFGMAGTGDFNYEEMEALDAALGRLGASHRFAAFDGDHSWGPERVASEAIDWLEIRAMRAGARPRDDALAEEIYRDRMSQAAARESAGGAYEAARAFRAIAEDFEGLRDVTEPRARAGELARSRSARRTEAQVEKLAARRRVYESRLRDFLFRFSSASPPPPLEESLASLQIGTLKTRAAAPADTETGALDAAAARRLLALVRTQTGFYVPRDFMDRKDPGRALAILRIAAAIEPGAPGICLQMARARAQIGQKSEAIADLRCLAAAPGVDASLIENDPLLAPLREEAGWREIVERLRAAAPPAP